MSEVVLDRIDVEIIKLLMESGLLSPKEMATRLGVSDRTVSRRLDRLRDYGVLEGFAPKLNPGAIPEKVRKELEIGEEIKVRSEELSLFIEAFKSILGCGFDALLYHAGKSMGKELHKELSAKGGRETLFKFGRELEGRGIELNFNRMDFLGVEGSMSIKLVSPAYEKLDRDTLKWFFKGLIHGFLEELVDGLIEVNVKEEGGDYLIEFKRS